MGQSYTKRGLSQSTSNKVVNFNFSKEDVSFDKLKKIREDIEAKDNKEYFSIKELSDILKSGIKRIHIFCQENDIKVFLIYYKKSHRQSNVISLEDAEYVIRNFK